MLKLVGFTAINFNKKSYRVKLMVYGKTQVFTTEKTVEPPSRTKRKTSDNGKIKIEIGTPSTMLGLLCYGYTRFL